MNHIGIIIMRESIMKCAHYSFEMGFISTRRRIELSVLKQEFYWLHLLFGISNLHIKKS